jgi:hypothetical protein
MSLSTTSSQLTQTSLHDLSVEKRSKESGLRALALMSNPGTWRASETLINSKNLCAHIESFVIPVEDGALEIKRTTLTAVNRLAPQSPKVECCAETRRNGKVERDVLSQASYKAVAQKFYNFFHDAVENRLVEIAENAAQFNWQTDPAGGYKTVLPGENLELSVKSLQLSSRVRPPKQDFSVTATLPGGVSVKVYGDRASEVFAAVHEVVS